MSTMKSRPVAAGHGPAADPDQIYRMLAHGGTGRELVTEDNVDALIALAHQHGNALMETELREWRTPRRPPAS